MEIYKESWCQKPENIFQDLNVSDCVVLDPMNACKNSAPVHEIIDISDDCDSNASTVIDCADLGSVSEIDSMIRETVENTENFNSTLLYFNRQSQCSDTLNDTSNFIDLTSQTNEDLNLNIEPKNQTEGVLDQIKISKIESLSPSENKASELIPAEKSFNVNKIDLKIKEELPDSQDVENSTDPKLNLLIVSDIIQKYLPYVEFQKIPSLVSNIFSDQAVESLEKNVGSEQNPEKKKRKFKCPFCSFADLSKDALKFHLFFHVYDNLTCKICHKKFLTKDILVDHIISHIMNCRSFTSIASRKCFICSESFPDNYFLNLHIQVHKVDGLYRCNICCYMVKTPLTFKNHWDKHFEQRLFICNDCGRPFQDKDDLAMHWHRSHSDKSFVKHIYPFRCERCEQVFNRHDILKRHMKTVHES